MSELQKEILALPPADRLALISFIAASLKEDRLFQQAMERRDKYRQGKTKILTLEELKSRLYG